MSGLRDLTRWPWAGTGHGPLPALLLVLTAVTGIVDAVSYIALLHVFVANMTGNVIFLGFALAGAPGLSATASLVSLSAFLLGAVAGGQIAAHVGQHRGHHLRTATAIGFPLVLFAVVEAALVGNPPPLAARYVLIVTLAMTLGLQNATARRLAVPDLTTTVLTLTLTGVASDSRLGGGQGGHPGRRLLAVGAMFAGALVGALLVVEVNLVLPLALAAVLMAITVISAHRLSPADADWARAAGAPPWPASQPDKARK
jgi:uncharacterized membrane protein YoaK (UPF0700 family)